jgi:hypothetical protein
MPIAISSGQPDMTQAAAPTVAPSFINAAASLAVITLDIQCSSLRLLRCSACQRADNGHAASALIRINPRDSEKTRAG